jgi:hypothetical protein
MLIRRPAFCRDALCIAVPLALPLGGLRRSFRRAGVILSASTHADDRLRPIRDSLAAASHVLFGPAMPPTMVQRTTSIDAWEV